MKNILLVTGTRAEYSLLKSIILKLNQKKFNLIIIGQELIYLKILAIQ